MGLTTAQKQAAIRAFATSQAAMVSANTVCSAHAMADIWDNATSMYVGTLNNDEESYVEDVAYVLAGTSEWAMGTDGTQVGQRVFTDSGFKKKFQDGSNQVQHFSAGVAAGFQYGRWAYLGHSVARPDSDEDEALNDQSTWLGANLNGIGTSLSGVKPYIIDNVCEAACGICNGGKGR